jgi:stage II sporulation protein D
MQLRAGVSVVALLACLLPASAGAGSLLIADGRGWGHGIGMSQWGAQGYAASGWSYRRILRHYYPGTALGRVQEPGIRVLLAEQREVWLGSAAPFRAVDAAGRRRVLALGGHRFGVRLRGLQPPVRFKAGDRPLRVLGREYRGDVVLRVQGRKLLAVNELALRAYLHGVVPREMPSTWNREALKAQAVAARSYALISRRTDRHYDVTADVRSQVYGGIAAEDRRTTAAVDATAGMAVLYAGLVAHTFYFSTSGGRTAAIADVWPGARPLPYLVSRPDPYDRLSPHHRWGPVGVPGARLHAGRVEDLRISRNPSGRVAAVVVNGAQTLAGSAAQKRLGLRSTWFSLSLLTLDGPARIPAGNAARLEGRLQGIRSAVLQRRDSRRRWQPVRRVVAGADGRFAVVRRPAETTVFRLSARGVAGAVVRVRVGAPGPGRLIALQLAA